MVVCRGCAACVSCSRIRAVAVRPSISGMWQSISTRSNGRFVSASTASRPFSTMVVVHPSSSSIVNATSRLTGLSSASRTWAANGTA